MDTGKACEFARETLRELGKRNFTRGEVNRFMKELNDLIRWSNERVEDEKPFVPHKNYLM